MNDAWHSLCRRLCRQRLVRALFAVLALLVAVDLCLLVMCGGDPAVQWWLFRGAATVPGLFNSLVLALAGVAAVRRAERRQRAAWWYLGGLFFLLALEEQLALHAYVAGPVKQGLGLSPDFEGAWLLPCAVPLLLLCIPVVRLVAAATPVFRTGFLLASALFLAGGVGLELVQSGWAVVHGKGSCGYDLIAMFEEGLEIAGAILYVGVLRCRDDRAFPARVQGAC